MIELSPNEIFSEIELIKTYFSKVNMKLEDLVKSLSDF